MTIAPLDLPVPTVGTPQAFYRRHNTTPRFPARHRLAAPVPVRTGVALVADPLPELYVDLTSPWAYLAHVRLDGPAGVPTAAPLWRVVQPDTGRPVAGLRGPGPEADRLREELEAARAAALDGEELPHDIPPVLPQGE